MAVEEERMLVRIILLYDLIKRAEELGEAENYLKKMKAEEQLRNKINKKNEYKSG
jgi:hypothetical protein